MNGYWEGLLEYNRQQEKKEQKKKNMKDLVDTMGECVFTLIIALLIGYALLCVGAYATFADEALTPDERVVALTLLGEARGEGDAGIYAVGCVILKRSSNRNLTAAQVCQEPWQFSIWNAGKGKIKKERELWYLYESPRMGYARQLAIQICANWKLSQEYTGNADHYYSHKIRKQPPSWAFKIERDKNGKVISKKPIKPTKVIGNHTFYKLR